MDKQTKLKIALPALALVMIFVWGPIFTGGGSEGKKKKIASHVSGGAVSQKSNLDLMALARSNERKKARTSYADWNRNPFVLSESPKASVLEGIMWDAVNPKAIINGDIVGVGDSVSSGVITDIQQASVTIKNGTVERIFRLGQ